MRQLQTSPSPAPGQRAPTVARRWTYDDDEEKQERGDDNETDRGDLLRRRDVQDAIFVVVNLLFRVGCLCGKVFLVVATPGTLAEDSFQGHAVRAGELAVAKVRSGPGCVS